MPSSRSIAIVAKLSFEDALIRVYDTLYWIDVHETRGPGCLSSHRADVGTPAPACSAANIVVLGGLLGALSRRNGGPRRGAGKCGLGVSHQTLI